MNLLRTSYKNAYLIFTLSKAKVNCQLLIEEFIKSKTVNDTSEVRPKIDALQIPPQRNLSFRNITYSRSSVVLIRSQRCYEFVADRCGVNRARRLEIARKRSTIEDECL